MEREKPSEEATLDTEIALNLVGLCFSQGNLKRILPTYGEYIRSSKGKHSKHVH